MLIGGRYDIIRSLGRGGFGKTYLATDTFRRNSPKCVVKKLQPQSRLPSLMEQARSIFEAEARSLYKLDAHHQIPKLYEHLEQNGEFYLVQELIDGHDLRQAFPLGDRWDESQVVSLLREILEILAFVQQYQIIHHDITPQNLIRRWKDQKLVLIDFSGIKAVRYLALTSDGTTKLTRSIGTPGYMPKEQIEGHPQLASDIYAVGMIGLQAVTGYLPNQLPRHPLTQQLEWHDQAEVSDFLVDLLDKMTAYEVDDRYQSALEVLEDLPEPPQEAPALFDREAIASLGDLQISDPTPEPEPEPGPEPKPIYRVAIAPQFEFARDFSEGLAAVVIDKKLGYIDKTGSFIIPPDLEFDLLNILRSGAYQFSEGLARLAMQDSQGKGDRWGYINPSGKIVIKPQFDGAETFREGLARVEMNHEYGYIDKTGAFAIKPQYESAAQRFSEGLADVAIGRLHGYIDKTGQVVIPPFFDSADAFSEGLARITLDNKYGFINKAGDIVILPQFDVAHSFQEGLARVRIDEKYGYMNPEGEIVILPQFEDTFSFTEGLALVRNDHRYGYINVKGDVVIPLEFEDAYPFSEGLAAVKVANGWGYIDRDRTFVVEPQFADTRSFQDGIAAIKQDGKWGYLRRE